MKNINKTSIFVALFALVFAFGPSAAQAKFSLGVKQSAEVKATMPATKVITTGECSLPIYARVVFNEGDKGARNWGTGDTARQVYVGGNAETDKYTDGKWFMLYDGKNWKTDGNLTNTYENVPGLAIQRGAGFVRTVLHGDWDQPSGHPLTNVERNEGQLEFSTDGRTVSKTVIALSQKSDPKHKMESRHPSDENKPGDDWMKIADGVSKFKMVVNTNNDGFYTTYKIPTKEDCK